LDDARAYLVESIPTDMPAIARAEGVGATAEVLTRLTREAKVSIDLTAMYWDLVPAPGPGEKSLPFSKEEYDGFGAPAGQALLDALVDAARRGVKVRIIEAPAEEPAGGRKPRPGQKRPVSAPRVLREEASVEIRQVEMPDWYGDGIMHQKIWVFDGHAIYLGSANMDWLSLTQVKEIGVAVESCPELAAEIGKYYEAWWRFCGLDPSDHTRDDVFDRASQVMRRLPAWSELVAEDRADSPLDAPELHTKFNFEHPMDVTLNGSRGNVCITGSPRELCVPDRTWDQDGLVRTIAEARDIICLSVMDFVPASIYHDPPVWWPALQDALLHAATTRGVYTRLLVSRWAHSNASIVPYLKALRDTALAARAQRKTAGQLEIKLFEVPGWQDTVGRYRKYPEVSRVNHTKYIVTERRANFGTSNMTWGYFANTAGASFNTDHAHLVAGLRDVFERDWSSPYVVQLP
jgi:phospholipase D3/4